MQAGIEVGTAAPARSDVRGDQDLPLIVARDLVWTIYLYPLRGLARCSSRAARALIWSATPLYRLMAASRKPETRKRLADLFGSELSAAELDAVRHRCALNFAARVADDLSLERGDKGLRCRAFSGREYLDEALAAGRGALLVSLHWYAGRAARRYLASVGYPVLAVRKREFRYGSSVSRFGKRLLEPAYGRFIGGIIRDAVYVEDPDCSLKILQRLRSGGLVDIHLDVPHSGHVIETPFLARALAVPAGALHLAYVAGCPALPMVVRGRAGSLEIEIDPPVSLDRALPPEEFCQRYLPVLVGILEQHVRERPEDWEALSVIGGRS